MRWTILRSPAFYLVRNMSKIVMTCCLLDNLIRKEVAVDPIEEHYNMSRPRRERRYEDHVDTIEYFKKCRLKRDQLAKEMFNRWRPS